MFNNDLMKACLAAVFAIGLAACSSSSDNGSAGTTDPMPTQEEQQLAALQQEIADLRAQLGIADDADIGDSITALMAERDRLQKQIDDAAEAEAEAEAEAMREAMAALGEAMHAALGPPATPAGTTGALANIAAPVLTAAGLAIDAAAGAGALPDTGDGSDPAAVTLEAGDSAGSLGSWMGTDYAHSAGTGDSKITNEARVYTNQEAPDSEPFGEVHELETDEDFFTVVTGGTVDTDANLALVRAGAFTHSGTQTHMAGDRADAVYLRGTYNGAPGEYRCAGTDCSSTNNGMGAPSALGGTWTFTPDSGATVSQPDGHYLYFGWWVSKDSDGDPTAASAFAGRFGTDPGDSTDGLDPAVDLTGLTGSATYVGNAAGKFAMSNPLDGTGNAGHFTADAELEATFSGDDAGVTGTIDNFRLNDGSEDPGWIVELVGGGLGAAGAITAPADDGGTADVNEALGTVWSINGNEADASGSWSGTMYDEMPGNAPDGDGSNIPTTVTGTFYSEFSTIGRMVGAFGAEAQ